MSEFKLEEKCKFFHAKHNMKFSIINFIIGIRAYSETGQNIFSHSLIL